MNIRKILMLILIVSGIVFKTDAQEKTDSTAEKMLIYQLNNGGWPKQLEDESVVKYELPLTDQLLQKIKATTMLHATIDNKATSREIEYLVKAYRQTHNKKYLSAAQRGIEYLFKAQYDNGGWPQYYPDKRLYRAQITFNDDAIVNVLNIMLNISTRTNGYDVFDAATIDRASKSVAKGIDCILKTQVKQGGILTIWGAQYDQNTLLPAKARNFEPVSLSASESSNIVEFLMRLKSPSIQIKESINGAVKWFDSSKITGYRFGRITEKSQPKGFDKVLIADPNSTIWARFYDLETNKPVFGDRDNSVRTNVADISYERRTGYAWYGNWGEKVLNSYSKWQVVFNN